MIGDKLTLDYKPDEGIVWLIVTSTSGLQHKELILLRNGFGPEDIREAVIATGWVEPVGGELQLTSDISCESLRDVVEAMLGYFVEPGVPGIELREIMSAVSEFDSVHELRRAISLYAYAWLDVMVRDDLADEARSTHRIWQHSEVVIDLARNCDRRVKELVARYSKRTTLGPIGAMAPSMPTRKPAESRAKLG